MKTKFILLYIFVGLTLAGCSDFLELTPPNNLSVATYYKTAAQIENAANAAYSSLQHDNLYGNWFILSEIPSDNTSNNLSGSVTDQDEFDKFYLKTTNPYLRDFWNESYKGINKCNMVLASIGDIDMDATLKDRLQNEMKFLRGLFYFNLVRVFGGVPKVIAVTTIAEAYALPRSSSEQIYEQIVIDLTAAESLPVSYTGNNVGRATSGAAKALLGKIYLTLGDYAKAEQKLKEVIDLNVYALLENETGSINIRGYQSVFDPQNHNHSESVFDVQFKKGGFGEGSDYPNTFAPENSGTSVVAVGGASGGNIPTIDMYDSYQDGDLRRDFSMAMSYVNGSGATIHNRHILKYRDVPYANGDNNCNFPVIRYADVLLMYAEALNENNKTAEACNLLNSVRRRGFGYQTSEVSPCDVSPTAKDEFKLLVEHERRVELAFECHRWFDLIRTGRAVQVMGEKGFLLDATNLIYPIPQGQIDINPDMLTQNTYNYH